MQEQEIDLGILKIISNDYLSELDINNILQNDVLKNLLNIIINTNKIEIIYMYKENIEELDCMKIHQFVEIEKTFFNEYITLLDSLLYFCKKIRNKYHKLPYNL